MVYRRVTGSGDPAIPARILSVRSTRTNSDGTGVYAGSCHSLPNPVIRKTRSPAAGFIRPTRVARPRGRQVGVQYIFSHWLNWLGRMRYRPALPLVQAGKKGERPLYEAFAVFVRNSVHICPGVQHAGAWREEREHGFAHHLRKLFAVPQAQRVRLPHRFAGNHGVRTPHLATFINGETRRNAAIRRGVAAFVVRGVRRCVKPLSDGERRRDVRPARPAPRPRRRGTGPRPAAWSGSPAPRRRAGAPRGGWWRRR